MDSIKESSATWDGFISGSCKTSLGHVVYSIAQDLQVKNNRDSISLAILCSRTVVLQPISINATSLRTFPDVILLNSFGI